MLYKSILIKEGACDYKKDIDLRSLAKDTIHKIWDIIKNNSL